MPVELPSKFELGINRNVAKALELEIHETLLAVADDVIDYDASPHFAGHDFLF